MRKTHIMLQGFGSFPVNFKALIERARELGDPIEWSIICTTGHYVKMYQDLLGKDAVLYLHSDIKNYLNTPDLLDRLSTYHGNIYRNIESEKRITKHKKAMRQLKCAAAMYLSMKAFIVKRKPTHILFGLIEGMDGMTLLSVGQELKIPALLPTHTRHLGETFLSPDEEENLPPRRPVTEEHRARARDALERFRAGKTSAAAVPAEIVDSPQESYIYNQPSFFRRALAAAQRWTVESELREPDVLRASILLNFPFIARVLWGTRELFNKRIYDIDSMDQLPKNFAYYPLQYSPEASINTLAPYFVDQIRAIDAIRFALPSDMMLVVKEHPACMGLRKLGFLNQLQKKAGIVMARYDMPSRQITDRAAITFSVTGTAALEGFMKGRPALCLGGAFFSACLNGPTGIDALKQRIGQALAHPPTDDRIIESLAEIYAVSGPYVVGSIFDPLSTMAKYSLNKTNIDNFYKDLKRAAG
jgi:hypothetical protein